MDTKVGTLLRADAPETGRGVLLKGGSEVESIMLWMLSQIVYDLVQDFKVWLKLP
jgi:hypothetical protein